MTDHADPTAPEGPAKTPRSMTQTVVLAFLVPLTLLLLVAGYFGAQPRMDAASDAFEEQAIALRLQPVGRVALADAAPAGGGEPRSGEQVYQAVCSACHAAGTLGAPKFGDKAAWAPRIAQGYDTLLNSALKGKNAMPAQGGGATSDFEIARAVVYLANASGGKFAEPPAPAASGAN